MEQEVYVKIKKLADQYAEELKKQVSNRMEEMKQDDNAHYLLYRVLGVTEAEGQQIDVYQNKGRFLYKYAGAFLEEAAVICIQHRCPDAGKTKIPNTIGMRPRMFEIDCLMGNVAHEIKWRDATTDGDHITKEHTRVKAIQEQGYTPVRVMFYYPQRAQARKIQETLETLYHGVGGEYYCGDAAWNYIHDLTGIDLLEILEKIADSRNGTYEAIQ